MSRFDLTDEDRENLEGCRVVASISGGKDSAALSLWLTEQGIEHDRVFADTGWEHPWTYEYLRGPLTEKIGPIAEVRADELFAARVHRFGIFPSGFRRWCTLDLKVKPLAKYAAEHPRSDGLIFGVGIRAEESKSRAAMARWEGHQTHIKADYWRPIIEWTERDVIEIHQRHGFAPNPLYLMGARRVGCWPCIHACKAEIKLMAELDPGRVTEIREMERHVAAECRRKFEARGETENAKGIPGFFRASIPGMDRHPTVDEVVQWSGTARGGRQMMLLDTADAGCVRWGMCEGHQ